MSKQWEKPVTDSDLLRDILCELKCINARIGNVTIETMYHMEKRLAARIERLADKIEPPAVGDLTRQLRTSTDNLAAAVAANQPADGGTQQAES